MKPVLVIMAAGMGSRFGGLKQITPVDDAGHILMDYSIFDAMRAGFGRVVLIIKPELEADFTNLILSRLSGEVQVDFAYQTPDRLNEVRAELDFYLAREQEAAALMDLCRAGKLLSLIHI